VSVFSMGGVDIGHFAVCVPGISNAAR